MRITRSHAARAALFRNLMPSVAVRAASRRACGSTAVILQLLISKAMTARFSTPHRDRKDGCQLAPSFAPLSSVQTCPLRKHREPARGGVASKLRRRIGSATIRGSGARLEAPALVSGFDDVAMVGEPVEQHDRPLGVAEV